MCSSVISKTKYRLMLSAQLIPHYLSENERDVTRFIGQSRAVSAACQCQLNNSSHFARKMISTHIISPYDFSDVFFPSFK